MILHVHTLIIIIRNAFLDSIKVNDCDVQAHVKIHVHDVHEGLEIAAQPLLDVALGRGTGGGASAPSASGDKEASPPSPQAATSKPLMQTVRILK